ncbi:HAD-IIIC family phosphatase [Leptothoe sp. LEGE 181152]|nr:HAD-IIIC family phosphatase [Leptothoe sp. LEGE 181152]
MPKPTVTKDNSHKSTEPNAGNEIGQLAVAATFTADPLKEILEFWFAQLGLAMEVNLTDYNQVFQQLLNPASLMAQNTQGINLLLIRIEDWIKFQTSEEQTEENLNALCRDILKRNSQDLINAIFESVQRSSTPHIVVFCPSNPDTSTETRALYNQIEQTIVEELSPLNNLYFIPSGTIFSRYPVNDFYDANRDRIGHIPFTPEAFAALGTIIARTVHALKRPPYKVIALDCDRTLWRGICGEDGPLGIAVDEPFRALQSFMVRCNEAGFLLCLCSKNVEEDVWQVFDQRDDMLLGREHLVGWRINWQPKSENLRSLATELNLGLDSFIFIDDNPVECSEVRAHCPEVLTLQLPEEPDQFSQFLNHIWPLDTLKVTEADKNRTQLYQQNAARKQFEQHSIDFKTFIDGLQLDINIAAPTPEQFSRVSQLTQRTNQFNATTCRYSESEIQRLCQTDSGYGCRAVTVKDRFGDYGLVGVIIFQRQAHTLNVDSFLLSCRVLGRGVEHQMLKHLGEVAANDGLNTVTLNYRPTSKNLPIAEFFTSVGHSYQQDTHEGCQYELPLEVSQNLSFNSSASTQPSKAKENVPRAEQNNPMVAQQQSKSEQWAHIVHHLWQPIQVLNNLTEQHQRKRAHDDNWSEPKTTIEKKLSEIWSKVLRIDRVSLNDNLFDLGCTSLLAVNAFTDIETILGKRLPISTLLDAPNIATLASKINQHQDQTWHPLVTGQVGGSKLPLYIVHGGYGDILSTVKIVAHLDNEQPVYILRGIGLDGQQQPLPSIEAMASAYIQAIKEKQPQGPYQLVGQCSGGIVAFEMAQQLTNQGDIVEFLGLLDTPHPQLENHFTNRLRYYFHRPTYRHHQWDRSYYLFTGIYYLRHLRVSFNYHLDELRKHTLVEQLRYVGRKLSQISSKLINIKGLTTATQNIEQQNKGEIATDQLAPVITNTQNNTHHSLAKQRLIKDEFFEVFLRAQKDYVPKTYTGNINFFLALQQSFVPKHPPSSLASLKANLGPVQDRKKLLFGWDTLVSKGKFYIWDVDCPHPAMFEDPYIQQLGKTIQIALDTSKTSPEINNDSKPKDMDMISTVIS